MASQWHFGLRISDCGFSSAALRSLLMASLLLASASWFLPPVLSQSPTATLSGTVEDQSGAVVPGASITVMNAATSLERQATTNDQGYFTISLLQSGNYTVTTRRDVNSWEPNHEAAEKQQLDTPQRSSIS